MLTISCTLRNVCFEDCVLSRLWNRLNYIWLCKWLRWRLWERSNSLKEQWSEQSLHAVKIRRFCKAYAQSSDFFQKRITCFSVWTSQSNEQHFKLNYKRRLVKLNKKNERTNHNEGTKDWCKWNSLKGSLKRGKLLNLAHFNKKFWFQSLRNASRKKAHPDIITTKGSQQLNLWGGVWRRGYV